MMDISILTVLFIVSSILQYFGFSYLKKKGSNQADKEDIQAITRLVESVKHDNSLLLESERNRNQLRLSVLDRRLEAHQKAFYLWRKMYGHIFTEDRGQLLQAVIDCHEFWNNNCLYLEPKVRVAFARAYSLAENHKSLSEELRGTKDSDEIKAIKESMRIILAPRDIIPLAVELPSISEAEIVDIYNKGA